MVRFALMLILCNCLHADDALDLGTQPAGEAMTLLLQVTLGDDREAALVWVRDNVGSEMRDLASDEVLAGMIFDLKKDHPGLKPKEVVFKSIYRSGVLLVDENEKRVGIRLRVADAAPHKIVGWQIDELDPETLPSGLPNDQVWIKALDVEINKYAEQGQFSGVLLLAKGDELLHHKAYGLAHRGFKVPVKTDTRFLIASVGKLFTTAVIGQLIEEGKLKLSTTVGEILNDFPNKAMRTATVEQLLAHTSGAPNFLDMDFWQSSKMKFNDYHQVFEYIRDKDLEFQHGDQFAYSNSGFMTLGLIIEAIEGVSFFQAVEKRVWEPASMKDTGIYVTDLLVERLAEPYSPIVYRFEGDEMVGDLDKSGKLHGTAGFSRASSPAGGAYSTAADLWGLIKSLRDGRIISPARLQSWTKIRNRRAIDFDKVRGYGLGFSLNEKHGKFSWGHSGSFPGTSAEAHYFPKYDYTVVIVSNIGYAARKLLDAVVEHMPVHFPEKTTESEENDQE